MGIAHWDEVEPFEYDTGALAGALRDLGEAAGGVGAGVVRWDVRPGARSTPVHRHGAEEELHFVLRGSGLSWQDGKTYEVGAGDCLLHRPLEDAHTLIAGRDGLDYLAFGPRIADEATHLPHAGILRINQTWVTDAAGPHPFERETAAGDLPMPDAPSPRHERILNLADVEPVVTERGAMHHTERDFGRPLGSKTTGMSHCVLAPGRAGYPLHCHSAEEEIFVVLDGEGVVVLGEQEHPVRAGSVVARPPATRVAHQFRAAPDRELTYLAWGTRVPNDIAFYPRSGKVSFRGIGLITRLERLDYWDGEE